MSYSTGPEHNGTPPENGPRSYSTGTPIQREKPGVEGIKPAWLAATIAVGIAMWAGIIAIVRRVAKLVEGMV